MSAIEDDATGRDRAPELTPLQKAAIAVRELRAQVDALKLARSEPIAIVGMACRFPGDGEDIEGFWNSLITGRDCMSEVPADRWDIDALYSPDADSAGKMYTRQGGFIRDIDKFDAAFFNIHPREAERIDPQQRMILETSWEALERAGIAPDRLVDSKTGVFFGLMTVDYLRILMGTGELDKIDPFAAMSNGLSFPAGRLSYALGLQGPSMVVATACSSSLVAMHLAGQSLRNRECDVAVAGGVNAILSPEMNVLLTKTHVLAPDGRSKAFDASADGYSRGEGCGALVLMRLSDAIRRGFRIHATIRGSAVNHCGRSGALTVPNGSAQVSLIRDAMQSAGITADMIDYVETHGTGTPLGDPIELRALDKVMRDGHSPDNPCWIGSVKTNIGHLEAAAGVAGVIKTVLALEREQMPPHLHFRNPTPHVSWDQLSLRVANKARDWKSGGRRRIAGVSSFGLSGINAHLIIEEAPPVAEKRPDKAPPQDHVLTISAKSESALRALAARLETFCRENPATDFGDVCFTMNTGRATLPYRLAVVADCTAAASERLERFAGNLSDPMVFSGQARTPSPEVAPTASLKDSAQLHIIAKSWVAGARVDWQALYREDDWRRLELPTYPFERQRCWVISGDLFTKSAHQSAVAEQKTNADIDARVRDYFYKLAWRPAGRAGLRSAASALPPVTDLAARINSEIPQLRERLAAPLEAYATLVPVLDQFAASAAAHILRRLGWSMPVGEAVSIAALVRRLGVVPAYHEYFRRLLEILAERHHLHIDGDRISVLQAPADSDLEAEASELIRQSPSGAIELGLLKRCAINAPAVLQGRSDPVELLFARDETTTLDNFYAESVAYRALNELIRLSVQRAIDALGPDRRLRILEVGGGTGATTSQVLPLLPADRTDYVFTDISPAFAAAAAQQFASVEGFRAGVFDLDRSGLSQGFAPGQFDLVLAVNVLHATKDVRRSTGYLNELLAPGGLIVAVEGVTPKGWLDIMFGLLPGWWAFTDRNLRPSHPLLGRDKWLAVLRDVGCGDAVAVPGKDVAAFGVEIQQAVIIGQRVASAERAPAWLVFGDGDLDDLVVQEIRRRGEDAVVVRPGEYFARNVDGSFSVDHSSVSDITRLWREAFGADRGCHGILYLWGLEDPPTGLQPTGEAWQQRISGGLLNLVNGLVAAESGRRPRLLVATRRAIEVEGNEGGLMAHQATLCGLGRVVATEQPTLNCVVLDLAGHSRTADALTLLDEATRPRLANDDTQIAIREGERRVARIVRFPEASRAHEPIRLSATATYLVTGGLGGLGMLSVKRLVDRGARHLALVGRHAASELAPELDALHQLGVTIRRYSADAADRAAMREVVANIQGSGYPLQGIIHAAGVLEVAPLDRLDWKSLWRVMVAKVSGTAVLQDIARDHILDFIVLFSSASALVGEAGTAAYTAANAFLGSASHSMRQQGTPATCIDWGEWRDIGMAKAVAARRQVRADGLQAPAMSPEEGLRALELAIANKVVQAAVLPGDLGSLAHAQIAPDWVRPMLSELSTTPVQASQSETEMVAALVACARPERETALAELCRDVIASTLGISTADIAADTRITDLDVDSLAIMEILSRLKQKIGITLYPREVYERPTVRLLAEYLAVELERSHKPGATAVQSESSTLATLEHKFVVRTMKPAGKRNAPIAFVLSAPRSGSTLLRVMLAGHSQLFAPPELHLLPFASMSERAIRLGATYFGEGLARALMELQGADARECVDRVRELERDDVAIQDVYRLLQSASAPRMLVDKTPAYAGSIDALRRAEQMFENARYICLVRHPLAVIESFVRMRFDRLIGVDDPNPHRLAEDIWYQSYRNIRDFAAEVGPDRVLTLRYEDLVRDPSQEAGRICDFLGIAFDEAVLRPYDSGRMHDGLHPESAPLNDPNFMSHRTIDAALADRWRQSNSSHTLSGRTREMAREFGYEIEADRPATSVVWSERILELSGGHSCLCEWGDPDGQPIMLIHGLLEHGAAWHLVAARLADAGYRVVAPDLRGHGMSDHTPAGVLYHPLDFLGDLDHLIRSGLFVRPIHLAGHSMGAALAALFAAARPHEVQSLVLVEAPVDAVARAGDAGDLLSVQLDYLATPPRHPVFPSVEEAANRLRQGSPSLSADFALTMARRMTEAVERGYRWRSDARLGARAGIGFGSFAGADPNALLRSLRKLSAPIAMVYGESSNLLRPEHAETQRESLPQANRVTLKGGHNLHYDAPGPLSNAIIDTCRRATARGEIRLFQQAGE